jgi:hypothetical protein
MTAANPLTSEDGPAIVDILLAGLQGPAGNVANTAMVETRTA